MPAIHAGMTKFAFSFSMGEHRFMELVHSPLL